MATLASIIKDVDKDVKGMFCQKIHAFVHSFQNMKKSVSCFCFLGSSDEVFALALYHFNHTLVTSDLPSPVLQARHFFYALPFPKDYGTFVPYK